MNILDKDRSEKPFAMSFIKLINPKNGTTLMDTDHNLLVYKVSIKCIPELFSMIVCKYNQDAGVEILICLQLN